MKSKWLLNSSMQQMSTFKNLSSLRLMNGENLIERKESGRK